jgi:hypothetical protein
MVEYKELRGAGGEGHCVGLQEKISLSLHLSFFLSLSLQKELNLTY